MATKGESAQTEVKRVVKVVKKQVKKTENKSEVQNGDQNGDQEAQMTVKLPTKKSAAKTETNVEVVKKQLPDGSIEEIKTTTTKTTVDGKTTISTKTETTIIPKEEEEEVEVEEEEEEEEQEENGVVEVVEENGDDATVEEVVIIKKAPVVENGHNVVTKEERSETTVTKKVAVVQKQEPEPEEEEEEEEIEEEQVQEEVKIVKEETKIEEKEVEEVEEEEEIVDEKVEIKKEEVEVEDEEEEEEVVEETKLEKNEEPEELAKEEEVEEEYEEVEEKAEEEKVEKSEPTKEPEEETEEEYESDKEEPKPAPQVVKEETETQEEEKEDVKEKVKEEVKKEPEEEKEAKPEPQPALKLEPTVPLREPSIPLEKVEDIEIKPIGAASETVTKSHTENTEIITNTERPTGPLSTQTEYKRIENIVSVNRTTKTLDQSYEQLTQQGVPTVKTYFVPPTIDRVSTSPLPSRPYQPVYPPTVDKPQERRHSLLLERLSTERQMPSDIYQNNYQYNNQSFEQQTQYSQEPQAEVLTVSNVKPSTITNSQWYQQQQQQQVKKDNIIYNNVTPSPAPPAASQTWNQPQPSPQPQYTPQPQYQPPPQPQYQPTYTENVSQERNTNSYQQNTYQPYTPKPTTWGTTTDSLSSSYNTQQSQYSLLNQNNTESYQKSSQQYSSSYVPPPWEQDSSYVAPTNVPSQPQNYYQPPPPTSTFSPGSNQGWQTTLPKTKYTKPPPTAYIPPAPNQSFVKSANEPVRAAQGKKTYYSEYERRYITVPESNYIPGESKYQPQPDPSPQYYYDNNEPAETVEPQWRKELREFTEKSSVTTEQTSVNPPWVEDTQYAKPPSNTIIYTATPTWSQTLRPRSWRERSFESEYVGSQEVSKTSTLGRGRPLSSYAKNNIESIPERARGVSVDRYNPNSYQAPVAAEHPPVQTHTLNVVPPAKSYHNPNVPAYHAQSRASAEPREQPVYPQARNWGESRASPIQSRSFKYLQWITGTDD